MYQKLIDTNQQISDIINKNYSSYEKDSKKGEQQNQVLEQNNNTLTDEKINIDKLSKEYALLNAANKNSQLVVTEYYSKYIVLIFVTLLLVLLILKFAITGGEQTGGGNNFINESIFLLILMIVSIGLAPVINNLNAYVFLSSIIISYIVIKMKIINMN
jgi:lipopolysaccharide export LptBFGC system permease protein LptF